MRGFPPVGHNSPAASGAVMAITLRAPSHLRRRGFLAGAMSHGAHSIVTGFRLGRSEGACGISSDWPAKRSVSIVRAAPAGHHVHMFLSIPPKLSQSEVIQRTWGWPSRGKCNAYFIFWILDEILSKKLEEIEQPHMDTTMQDLVLLIA